MSRLRAFSGIRNPSEIYCMEKSLKFMSDISSKNETLWVQTLMEKIQAVAMEK